MDRTKHRLSPDPFYNMSVACGPCYPLIRLQALRAWPVSATITNAAHAHHH
ncbi:hypothetical protein [Mucilaginibacter sp. SJ]|uniref:hypothetical protein n=1 Tax=Mucilaginibacter sp. SJ TaxID=3029053 RepID=UPI0023A9A3F1|nr:hypothetical protein [Mucilaginibacter sp. SJ]WEA03558.1 hypothetical protein MusilaSJ_11475 [Mucilaginibacter sp. SJ]